MSVLQRAAVAAAVPSSNGMMEGTCATRLHRVCGVCATPNTRCGRDRGWEKDGSRVSALTLSFFQRMAAS